MNEVVKLERVIKMYEPDVRAVNDVSLDISAGEFTLISGRRKCGKTSLLHLINGVEQPSEGSIRLFSNPLKGEKAATKLRLETIGTVPNEPSFLKELTMFELIELPLRLLGWKKQKRRIRVFEVLEQFDLVNCAYYKSSQMSVIERYKTSLAMAMVKEPKLLLIDDILCNIPNRERNQLGEMIQKIYMKNDITIIYFASHVFDVLRPCQHFLMEEGKISLKEGLF